MIVIRQLPDQEITKIQPLFSQVFRHTISTNLLKWKYGQGCGTCWVAETTAGDILLHCGTCQRDILFFGSMTQASQLVDLMAAPKSSGLSRDQAPFPLLMRALLASLKMPDNPLGLAFGFPSSRAMRLGELAGVYQSVDDWYELTFSPSHPALGLQVRSIDPEPISEIIDKLWAQMAKDFSSSVLGVRNWRYLRKRYAEHPEKRYVFLLAATRWGNTPHGLVILAPETTEGSTWEILDIISAWNDMPEILQACRHWLRASRIRKSLSLMLTSSFAKQLAPFSQSFTASQFRIMASPVMDAVALDRLPGRWWLTGGDTDYR